MSNDDNVSPYGLTFTQIEASLGQKVIVHLKNGEIIDDGFLYNVDPVTLTVLLLKEGSGEGENVYKDSPPRKFKIIAIMQSIMESLEEHEQNQTKVKTGGAQDSIPKEKLDSLVTTRIHDFVNTSERMKARKRDVISFFEANRIQVIHTPEDPIIHVMDRAHISPPYVPDSILCDNEIMLKRVKDLILRIPLVY
ncbi:10227_t:CDS:2 [Ambispora leptoticha]|uniref:10227_t:CDS:1 n=1 Tax=Ambispora leptoticha TaxID=144679 RepID=A0A9N8VZ42_9GLOM|nr:10227_t:CDS:2 [Ambispora leptoticha]